MALANVILFSSMLSCAAQLVTTLAGKKGDPGMSDGLGIEASFNTSYGTVTVSADGVFALVVSNYGSACARRHLEPTSSSLKSPPFDKLYE
jgi:hypothetical protein